MAVESIKRRCRGKREKSREQAPSSALLRRMSRLTRDGTAEPVTRDQIIRHERGQTKKNCSVDLEQDWQPYPVELYSAESDNCTYFNIIVLSTFVTG